MKAIVAVDKEWNIGKEGKLLAHLPKDLKRFKHITEGHYVIMGRKTLESLPGGKPLSNRTTILLTRDTNYKNDEVIVVNSFEQLLGSIESLSSVESEKDFIICGGGEIYESLLEYTNEVIVTKINHIFSGCDAKFPNLDESNEWEAEIIGTEVDGDFSTEYVFYSRVK